eukprot:4166984-Amphidinium_carterae.1
MDERDRARALHCWKPPVQCYPRARPQKVEIPSTPLICAVAATGGMPPALRNRITSLYWTHNIIFNPDGRKLLARKSLVKKYCYGCLHQRLLLG